MAYQGGEIVGPEPRAKSRRRGGAMSLWRNARVHTKVAVIVIIAALGLSWFAMMRVLDKWNAAAAASQAGITATLSVKTGDLLHATQRERGRSSQFMSSRGTQYHDDLTRQRQETDARMKVFIRFANSHSGPLPADVRTSFGKVQEGLDGLTGLRTQVDRLQGDPTTVIGEYTSLNQRILGLIAVLAATNSEPSIVARLQAYQAFLSAKEATGQERAQLSNVLISNGYGPGQYITVVSLIAAQQDSLTQFERIATPDVLEIWKQAQATAAFGQVASHEKKALALPTGGAFGIDPAAWWDTVTSKIDEMKKVEDVQAGTIVALAESVENAANSAARVALAVVGLLLVVTVTLAIAATRSIARPVQRLTRAAAAVADLADRELARVTDVEDADEPLPPRLAAIEVSSRDEVGELAEAFNRVQTTATLLVERQMMMRRNVGLMFANVAQRTQNLVNRQLTIVDQLECDEKNKHALATLYKLDHLSTRLGRSAKNLLVISGARDDPRMVKATPLATALRSALAEIEEYQRVRVGTVCEGTVASPLVTDLIVVFAELLENATTFSPPTSFVDVHAEMSWDLCQVSIVDHGIGIPADQMAEENHRLVERERLDITPTGVLGLFVVGRLARRHGLTVELLPTPGGGTTARLTIPPTLFCHEAPAPVLVGASQGQALATSAMSPRGLTLPTVILPAALSDGFPWFSHPAWSEGLAYRDADAARAAPRSALPTESAPVPDESVAMRRRADIEHPAGAALPASPQRGSHDGLVRRVRGAQLPTAAVEPPDAPAAAAPTADRPAAANAVADAAAARAAMDGFQAAVTRFAGPLPSQPPPPPAGPEPSARSITARGIAGAVDPAIRNADHGRRRPDGPTEMPWPNGRVRGAGPARGSHAGPPAVRDQYGAAPPRRDAEAQRTVFDSFTAGLAKAVEEISEGPGRPPRRHDLNEEIQR
jgi:signal transduction histidine kinase